MSMALHDWNHDGKKDWQDIEVKVSLIKNEISRLDDEINSVLNYIEETSYNAAQGYKVHKVFASVVLATLKLCNYSLA